MASDELLSPCLADSSQEKKSLIIKVALWTETQKLCQKGMAPRIVILDVMAETLIGP